MVHVRFAIGRKIEHSAGGLLVVYGFNTVERACDVDDFLRRRLAAAPHAHESAERAVMRDVGIGDRTDHARVALAEFRIEDVLQPDHIGPARRV